jgi:hypothetical protein
MPAWYVCFSAFNAGIATSCVLGVLSLYSMSGDASGKPTPSYKEILRSKDKAVSEANTLLKGERKNR